MLRKVVCGDLFHSCAYRGHIRLRLCLARGTNPHSIRERVSRLSRDQASILHLRFRFSFGVEVVVVVVVCSSREGKNSNFFECCPQFSK